MGVWIYLYLIKLLCIFSCIHLAKASAVLHLHLKSSALNSTNDPGDFTWQLAHKSRHINRSLFHLKRWCSFFYLIINKTLMLNYVKY